MGAKGLASVAKSAYQKAHALVDAAVSQKMAERRFTGPYFHECVLSLGNDASERINKMREHRIEPGYVLSPSDGEFDNELLVCVTETKTEADITRWLTEARG